MANLLPLAIFIVAIVLGWLAPRDGVRLAVLSIPAYVIKFAIGPLPTQLNEIIVLGVAVGWLARSPKAHFQKLLQVLRPIGWPLLLLAVGLLISLAVSDDLRLSLGILKGWFVVPIILFGLIVNVMTKSYLEELVPLLMLSTLPISIWAIIQVITGQFVTIDGRASAWFESANYLALFLVPILLLGTQILFNPGYKRSIYFWLTVTIPGLVAVYFSYSYGGWLGLLAGVVTIGVWHFRARWQFWLISAVAIIGAGLSQLTTERVSRMFDLTLQSSASVRLQVWATDLAMIKQHWLTGIGLGGYPALYPVAVKQLFTSPLEPAMLHAHNLYFQFIINLGIAGLISFSWLIVTFFRWVRRSSTWWAIPLTAAMVSILVHGLGDTPYWKSDLSVVFWVLLALAYHRFQLAIAHDKDLSHRH